MAGLEPILDCITMSQFSKEQIKVILKASEEIKGAKHNSHLDGIFKETYGRNVNRLLEELNIMLLFLENSTRTYFSSLAAALFAGGNIGGVQSADNLSLKKGESWSHTIEMFLSQGWDAMVMRSTLEGLPKWSVEYLQKSHAALSEQYRGIGSDFAYRRPMVINGGDGKHEHPTQCLLDLFTMMQYTTNLKKKGTLKVALLNDLSNGRTVHSLMQVIHMIPELIDGVNKVEVHLAYPDKKLAAPDYLLDHMFNNGVKVVDHGSNLRRALKGKHFAYQTRPQKERFGTTNIEDIADTSRITKEMLDMLGFESPLIMHPLPVDRVTFEELEYRLDHHSKNITIAQASFGPYVRTALMAIGLGRMLVKYPLSEEKEYEKLTVSTLPDSKNVKDHTNSRTGRAENGIVIDHIPPGYANRIYGVLGLRDRGMTILPDENLPPRTENPDGEWKDIIKVHLWDGDRYEFSGRQYEAIALLAPQATISFIEDGKVVKKIRPNVPDKLYGHIKCANNECVTNVPIEHVTQEHIVTKKTEIGDLLVNNTTKVQCGYCETTDNVPNIYKEERFIYDKNAPKLIRLNQN